MLTSKPNLPVVALIFACVLCIVGVTILLLPQLFPNSKLGVLISQLLDSIKSIRHGRKINLIHDQGWHISIYRELGLFDETLKYIQRQRDTLSSIDIPQTELDTERHSPNELIDHVNDILSSENLQRTICRVHNYERLPLSLERKSSQVIEILSGTLITYVPQAKGIIISAMDRAKKHATIELSLKSFMRGLFDGIKKGKAGGIELKLFLEGCLSNVLSRNDNIEIANILNSYNAYQSKGADQAFSKTSLILWNLMEIGLFSGFSYFINDLDDISINPSDFPDTQFDIPHDFIHIDGTHIDIDGIATVSLPIAAIMMEGFKQIRLLSEERTSKANAAANLFVSVGSKMAGATAMGAIGAKLGTLIAPGIGTIVGGIAGSILGSVFGSMASKSWKIERFKSAKNDFEQAKEKMGKEMDDANITYYQQVTKILEQENSTFKNTLQSITVEPSRDDAMLVIKKLILGLTIDLKTLEDWYGKYESLKYPSRHLKGLAKEVSDYVDRAKKVLTYLSSIKPEQHLDEIKKMPLPFLERGEVSRQKDNLFSDMCHFNGRMTLGLIMWSYTVEGIFYTRIEEVSKRVVVCQEEVKREAEKWKTILNRMIDRIKDMAAQAA